MPSLAFPLSPDSRSLARIALSPPTSVESSAGPGPGDVAPDAFEDDAVTCADGADNDCDGLVDAGAPDCDGLGDDDDAAADDDDDSGDDDDDDSGDDDDATGDDNDAALGDDDDTVEPATRRPSVAAPPAPPRTRRCCPRWDSSPSLRLVGDGPAISRRGRQSIYPRW